MTEEQLKNAKQEGARKEAQRLEAEKMGALEIAGIIEETAHLYQRIAALDKRKSELLGYDNSICGAGQTPKDYIGRR